jgi:hypothetical protein
MYFKVFEIRQYHRMNRLAVLLVALLLSNIAASVCAMAYALCIDCPEQQPVACAHADTCTTAEVINGKPSTEVLDTTYRPIVYVSPPITSELKVGLATVGVAATDVTDLPPVLPLNLLLCVFLN